MANKELDTQELVTRPSFLELVFSEVVLLGKVLELKERKVLL